MAEGALLATSAVATSSLSEFTAESGPDAGWDQRGRNLGGPHCRAPTRKAGVMPDSPLRSRQHSPLYETAKPGWAADEPLRGVDLLQEVIGETLDDGPHVRGTALHELHHLQHTVKTFNAAAN